MNLGKANRIQAKTGFDNPTSTALARACCRVDRAERETEPNLDHNDEHVTALDEHEKVITATFTGPR